MADLRVERITREKREQRQENGVRRWQHVEALAVRGVSYRIERLPPPVAVSRKDVCFELVVVRVDPLVARLGRGVEQIGDANAETQEDISASVRTECLLIGAHLTASEDGDDRRNDTLVNLDGAPLPPLEVVRDSSELGGGVLLGHRKRRQGGDSDAL